MTRTQLPAEFEDLAPYVAAWGLPTLRARIEKRATSSVAQLRAFHAAVLPRLDEIIRYLNGFAPGEIPESALPLAWMALSMVQIDAAVNKFDAPVLPAATDPREFVHKTSFYDMARARRGDY